MENTKKKSEKEKNYRAYGLLTALAVELVVFIVVSIFIGSWIDKKLNLPGLATLGLMLISFGVWVVILIRALEKLDKKEKEEENEKSG